jgi:hypothetical protein
MTQMTAKHTKMPEANLIDPHHSQTNQEAQPPEI